MLLLPTWKRIAAVPALAACLIALGSAAPGTDKALKDRHGDPLPPGARGRLGTIRLRANANALLLLRDGKTLLTVSGGHTLARWDAGTGRLLGETHLPGVHGEESVIAPDGKIVAVVEEAGISVWDVAAGQRLHLLPRQFGRCTFAPDGKTLATTEYSSEKDGPGRGLIHLWDVATGADRVLAELPSHAGDLAFAPDGSRLYAVADGSLLAWDLPGGKHLWRLACGAATLAVSSDGKTLLSDAFNEGELYEIDANTGQCPRSIPYKKGTGTAHLALSPDGKLAAQALWHETVLWDLEQRKVRHRFPEAGPLVAFAADGKSLFTAGNLLLRWDVATGQLLYADSRHDGHIGPVASLAFAPGGKSLASTGQDGTLRLWSLADASHRILRPDGAVHGARELGDWHGLWGVPRVPVCFTPDGRQVLSDVALDTLALTDVTTGKEGLRFKMPHDVEFQYLPARTLVSADGKTVLVRGHSNERQLRGSLVFNKSEPVFGWDAVTGKLVLTRTVPGSFLDGAAFAPDGRWFFAGHGKLTDLKSGGQRALLDVARDMGPASAFSQDGRLLAVTELLSDQCKAVRIHETLTGCLVDRAEGQLGKAPSLAFSRDGRLFAAPGQDALYVWETATGKRVLLLEAKGRLKQGSAAAFATCLAFAPDGTALATGHADGTVLLWDLAKAWAGLSEPGAIDVESCWSDLALADGAKAQSAIERLIAAPARSLPLLKQRVGPVVIDPAWLASRLDDLGSPKFPVREAAMRDLEKVGQAIESDLRRLVEKPPSLEVRARLLQVLKVVEAGQAAVPPLPDVRKLRAVTILERIGTPEARAQLRELAGGAADALLTDAARSALARMDAGR